MPDIVTELPAENKHKFWIKSKKPTCNMLGYTDKKMMSTQSPKTK